MITFLQDYCLLHNVYFSFNIHDYSTFLLWWFQLHRRTFSTRYAGPPPAKVSRCVRFVSCTLSAVDALTSGCVAETNWIKQVRVKRVDRRKMKELICECVYIYIYRERERERERKREREERETERKEREREDDG